MSPRGPIRNRRHKTALLNRQAALFTSVGIAVIITAMIVMIVRHDRSLNEKDAWISSVPWDPSWPSLPVVNVPGALRIEVARAVYGFVGNNAEVLEYIPCYCPCRSEGHRNNLECYVKQRSPDGRVTEWDSHGQTCDVGLDITGDVMLWHEKGRTLSAIRNDIDQEYSSRGPGTLTPPPPSP